MTGKISSYDKLPFIKIDKTQAIAGWEAVVHEIQQKINSLPRGKKIIVFEFYQGVNDDEIISNLNKLSSAAFYYAKDCMLAEEKINQLVYPDVTDDEIFGYITRLSMAEFFDKEQIAATKKEIESDTSDVICIYGPGASLLADKIDLLVYFDMPRWEIQLRFRKNEVSNLGLSNASQKASLQYKQAFFVDWRVCDKHKKTLMPHWDYVVDTTRANSPVMVDGKTLNSAFEFAVTRPFRLLPFFDPGPWGGQWMKEELGLEENGSNYAWAFDCVPEENSLVFQFGETLFETPAINLVFAESKKLLGNAVQARFGDEFPIRFDFLDTMDGGNLSLQVHPTTDYIHEHFGMRYTQDESYYMMQAGDDACVYLGLKTGADGEEMIEALRAANTNATDFDADTFVEKWPVKKHDHVLIPAGTVHCSGKNSMVLEISATPYIFTFKLWDWGRMGLDGKPRPINIEHGKNVIDFDIRTDFAKNELINQVMVVAEGDGWLEERTGLHEREFIETRRHWFSKPVKHDTNGSVNVLNLVEGAEVIVESPHGNFEPFIVHYAETFVVPENVKEYTVTPHGVSVGKQCATMKAFVRTKPWRMGNCYLQRTNK